MVTSQAKHSSEDARPYLRRFLFLLIALLVTLILGPALEGIPHVRFLVNVFWTLVLISSVYAVSRNKRVTLIATLLALPFFAAEWSSHFITSLPVFVAGRVCAILFFAIVIYHILRFIYGQQDVRLELVIAAVVVYLLIATMWAYFYAVLETVHPGSFHFPDSASGIMQNRFIYFSFVTITTLGYGDITPATGFAASLSVSEAVIGQLYITVQVAWLVGIHVASHFEKRSRKASHGE